MCGLVGVAGDLAARDNDVFKELLWADTLRGGHSTGAAFIEGHGRKCTLVKQPGSPLQIMGRKEFTDANNSWRTNVIIGHNRFATVGGHTEENAHPFAFSNIVGAHNGTLDPRARKILPDNEKFGTDSEALYHSLNELDPVEVMAEMSGAWALTWYDRRNHTINFLRNNQRPLHYCFNKAGDVMYWASESGMLRWILSRERRNVETGPIYELNPDVWASFTVAGNKTCFGEPRLTEVKGWKPAPFVPLNRGHQAPIPWEDGREEEGAWSEWGQPNFLLGPAMIGPGAKAHERGSPVMDGESSKEKPADKQPSRSNSAKRPNASAAASALKRHDPFTDPKPVLPGLPQPSTKPSGSKHTELSVAQKEQLKLSLEKAWGDGFVAGDRGLSKTQNPFPSNTDHSEQWLQGRLSGLECFRHDASKRAAGGNSHARTSSNFKEDADDEKRIRGYNAELITEAEFNSRTGGECRWGGCAVEFTDKVQWLGRNDCVCEQCVTGNKLVRELLGKAA